MIFEKAYAAWKGGFDAIEGGMSATALEALTGARPDFFPVTSDSKPDVALRAHQGRVRRQRLRGRAEQAVGSGGAGRGGGSRVHAAGRGGEERPEAGPAAQPLG